MAAGAGTKKHTKGKDQSTIKEIQHLENVFGTDLRNYSHRGYARAELPYTVRDATTTTANKRKRK